MHVIAAVGAAPTQFTQLLPSAPLPPPTQQPTTQQPTTQQPNNPQRIHTHTQHTPNTHHSTLQIDREFARCEARAAARNRRNRAHHDFFARRWLAANRADGGGSELSQRGLSGGASTATAAAADDDGGGAGIGGCCAALRSRWRGWDDLQPAWSAASNYALSALQYFALFPGVMLLALVAVLRVVHDEWAACAPLGFRRLPRPLPGLRPLAFPGGLYAVILLTSGLSAACAPLWFALSFRLRPRAYVRLACASVVVSSVALLAAVFLPDVTIASA